MSKPKVIILSGYGLNCEDETAYAFKLSGGTADIVHINDLIERPNLLKNYQILAVPGGFSYGDDTGSGKAYANKLKNHLEDQLQKFVNGDKLVIGICNGFQILTQAGILPGALTSNVSARYIDRWVDVKNIAFSSVIPEFSSASKKISGIQSKQSSGSRVSAALARDDKEKKYTSNTLSPWLRDITQLSLPIAHGEGNYYADKQTLNHLKKTNSIALVYTKGEICELQNLPPNPNGSMENIAGITGQSGRVLGLMPHPERGIRFTQLPHWTLLKEKIIRQGKKLPEYTTALKVFENAVEYFA